MTVGVPAALWGLLAVPCLIALYLLRVRRRNHPVSSILLWQRSAPTLAAYRPARQIERSLLLLLQILAAAAVVLALARPSLIVPATDRGDVMLVMDLSLSMRARDVAPTRFDRARAEALAVLARLRPGGRAGIVAAGPRPQLLVPLTGDRARVAAALRALEPWDAAGDVRTAVLMAADYPMGPDGRILVWTDGARGGLPSLSRAVYRVLGTSDDNVGISAFRVVHDPAGAEALLRVDNFSARPRRVPVVVTHGRTAVYRAAVDLPPGGSRSLIFPVSQAGEYQARLDAHDALPEDDAASAVLDPAPLPSVLLVSAGNPYLERLLRILPVSSAAITQSTDPAVWARYGVVILDRQAPAPVPPGDYLLIASIPSNLPVTATGETSQPEFTVWDRTDPIMQFVDLGSTRVARAMALATDGGRVLAGGGDAPLLWAYEGGGIRAVLMSFTLQDSDLAQRVAFPVLIANSLAWLGGEAVVMRAGEALQMPAGGGASAELTGPAGQHGVVPAVAGMFPLPRLTRAGVYSLKTPSGTRMITVRPAEAPAGLIRPGTAPAPAAGAPGAAGRDGAAPVRSPLTQLPVWPWFMLGAIGAVSVEWILATRRRGGDV